MIIIGADLVPTSRNYTMFSNGDADALLGERLQAILNGGVFRIFNLEIPFTDKEEPIAKCGPNMFAPIETAAGLRAIGVDLVTLANNHILDQGEQGLRSTWGVLDSMGIPYVGAGVDPEAAAKPYYFSVAGKRVGVYGCAEHEFSLVTNTRPGANPFDPLETPDHIAKMKSECDYVIVLYHGGREHYRYPTPALQKTFRKLVDKGADLVISQHTHCIGCEEKYNGGTIVYGQGNFISDYNESECWQTGLLVCVDDQWQVSYIPLRKTGASVRMAEGEDADSILGEFAHRSECIKQDGFVEEQYGSYADEMVYNQLKVFAGYGLFRRGFLKLFGKHIPKGILKIDRDKYLLRVWNYLDCEAHRELALTGIKRRFR